MSVSSVDSVYSSQYASSYASSSVSSGSSTVNFADLLGLESTEETSSVLSSIVQSSLSLTGEDSSSGIGDILSMFMMYSLMTSIQNSSSESEETNTSLCSQCAAAYDNSTADTQELLAEETALDVVG